MNKLARFFREVESTFGKVKINSSFGLYDEFSDIIVSLKKKYPFHSVSVDTGLHLLIQGKVAITVVDVDYHRNDETIIECLYIEADDELADKIIDSFRKGMLPSIVVAHELHEAELAEQRRIASKCNDFYDKFCEKEHV